MSGANKHVTANPPVRHTSEGCMSIRDVLSLVGDKWSILIVGMLSGGTMRFAELQRGIEGISQRMLTRTLRELERYGLVARAVEPTVPPRVYYSLTPLGATLLEPVKAVADWSLANYPKIKAAKEKFDKKSEAKAA